MTPPIPPAPPAPEADRSLDVPEAARLRPFTRVDIPSRHRPPERVRSDNSPIDGNGYDCGCRATTDYDGKIGEDIGNEVAQFVKIITGLIVVDRVADVISRFLGNIPIIGPVIRDGMKKILDDKDPLKNLFKKLGSMLDALLVDSLIRAIPSWVPAYRRIAPELVDAEQEVEGLLVRSHQRYDSIPFTQWHAYYDWTFQVAPDPAFSKLVGFGNTGRDREDTGLQDDVAAGLTRYDRDTGPPGGGSINRTINCDWDLGALGDDGPFLAPINENPGRDWAWPMTGAHFWATGRCMYDCSHATSDVKQGNDPGLHLNQLRPCKAIATARWEGVKFDENAQAVPAVQFMFFASRSQARSHDERDESVDRLFDTAGDFRFPPFDQSIDYEFEVQLPPAPARDARFAIGATPGTLLNTLVPAAPLLMRVDVGNFRNANDEAGSHGIRPEIIPIRPDGGGPPTRVRLKIPLTTFVNASSCGMIVSLGWHDPAGRLARRVFVVTVRLQLLAVREDHELIGDPEFRVNVAVNGRWMYYADGKEPGARKERDKTNEIARNGTLPLNRTITLFLAADDAIVVSVHGMEEDAVGDIMRLPADRRHPPVPDEAASAALSALTNNYLNDRVLRGPKAVKVLLNPQQGRSDVFQVPFLGRPIEWKKDLDPPERLARAETKAEIAHASIIARAMFLRLATRLLDANDPIGMIDPNMRFPKPDFGRVNDASDTPNPLVVRDVIAEVGLGRSKACQLTAYQTTVIGRMANLAYDRTKIDYILRYEVKVDAQPRAPA